MLQGHCSSVKGIRTAILVGACQALVRCDTFATEAMAKYFNVSGPCSPDVHYMLPAEQRLEGVGLFIERGLYFVIHAPRQVGKTTAFRALARRLTAQGQYAALHVSCETAQAAGEDIDLGVATVIDALAHSARNHLPAELHPPDVRRDIEPTSRLLDVLARWAERSPLPVVLFLDEIDTVPGNVLISLLRQIRAGYPDRPDRFPHSMALVGMRDVRDYRMLAGQDLGTASPFNIKVRSLKLRDFTAEEAAQLLTQHTRETGQRFSEEALALVYELTLGQPWLVNAFAEQITDWDVTDRSVTVEASHVLAARETLIQRRDTHLDSLVARLREARVQRVIEAVLTGDDLSEDVLDDDLQFVKDLGLVRSSDQGLEISNPIYREIVPRVLTQLMEESLVLPRPSYVDDQGRLDFDRLLDDFEAFWLANAEEYLGRSPYSEAAAHLVFMGFLHKITNGKGGLIDREYAAGRRRLDIYVRWPLPSGETLRWALEIKVWRDRGPNPLAEGLNQLGGYLERLGLDEGTLLIFDTRSKMAGQPERVRREEHRQKGCRIIVRWL